jgi:hypothetical protein
MRQSPAGQNQAGTLFHSLAMYARRAHSPSGLQVASEKAELLAVLGEYERDINLLESLYNEHKALLDQHHLDADLKELAEYAPSRPPILEGV